MAIAFFVEVVTAGAGDTFSFEAISSTDDALTAGIVRLALRGPLTAATIPVGSVVVVPIPPGQPTTRYLGGRYTLGTGDALTCSAFLVPLSFLSKLKDYATAIVVD